LETKDNEGRTKTSYGFMGEKNEKEFMGLWEGRMKTKGLWEGRAKVFVEKTSVCERMKVFGERVWRESLFIKVIPFKKRRL